MADKISGFPGSNDPGEWKRRHKTPAGNSVAASTPAISAPEAKGPSLSTALGYQMANLLPHEPWSLGPDSYQRPRFTIKHAAALGFALLGVLGVFAARNFLQDREEEQLRNLAQIEATFQKSKQEFVSTTVAGRAHILIDDHLKKPLRQSGLCGGTLSDCADPKNSAPPRIPINNIYTTSGEQVLSYILKSDIPATISLSVNYEIHEWSRRYDNRITYKLAAALTTPRLEPSYGGHLQFPDPQLTQFVNKLFGELGYAPRQMGLCVPEYHQLSDGFTRNDCRKYFDVNGNLHFTLERVVRRPYMGPTSLADGP